MDKYILVKVEHELYTPTFDINTDQYIDVSPYRKYQRNCINYECRCRSGAMITNNQSFKQHIKSKTHKEFIKNYKNHMNSINDFENTLKEKDIEIEFLKRKNIKLEKIIKDLNLEIEIIKEKYKKLLDNQDEFYDCD